MNEMIERVGEALAKACLDEFDSTWSNDVRWKFARVAIAAMREPTDEMADIAQEKYCGQPRETAVEWAKEDKWDAHRQDLIDEYQIMIDAALKE